MKTIALFCLLFAFPGLAIQNGDSKQQVLSELGNPDGVMTMGGSETLLYSGVGVMIKDGKVTGLPHNFAQKLAAAKKASLVPKPTATPKPAKKKQVAGPPPARKHSGAVRVIKNGGKRVDLGSVITKGKITVVDFYADWCGPCKRVKPYLVKLARENPQVNLVQIDIVGWQSDVAKQYKLRSIPHMRVYDKRGKQVGNGTSDLRSVLKSVEKAAK